ncbi:MAG TPA: lipid-A-disaccharide synthase [Cyclobacteriaceae bacterium]|nr:lipid-A-disaccharide synthase [Cyclobacteriaceae bacterium]
MRYYIIAGERSGDLHGGNLVKALKDYDKDAALRGFGGEYMQQAGVALAVHYREMAFMGLAEILTNLNKISQYIKRCKADIDQFKPDVIILIDYGGFNRRIAKYGKKMGIKVFYYIPPKVWAWYQSRAKEIKANVDKLFVILPFEKEFYKKFDWAVDYVGNPVLDAVNSHVPDKGFSEKIALKPTQPVVALLPGSRKQELIRIIPLMADVVKHNRDYQFVVAEVDNLDPHLYDPLRNLDNVKFVIEKTYDVLLNSNAAIVTSGTATLETALFNVPQVVVYKTSGITYQLVKRLIKVPFISLVNLIADKEVIKELIQTNAAESQISAELNQLISGERRNAVLADYKELRNRLDAGGSASDNTARLMWNYLNR